MLRFALLLALAVPAVAASQSAPSCTAFVDMTAPPAALGLAKVTGADPDGRLHFSADSNSGRPCLEARCNTRAYLTSGDELVTAGHNGPFVCAWFKPKGRQVHFGTFGWVRANALTPVSFPTAPPQAAWGGKWVRDRELGLETSLTIHAVGPRLSVKGSTLFAHSREDIARGAVNEGEVDDVIDVRGVMAGLLVPGPGGRPQSLREEDYKYECKIGMALLGDWLIVADNSACGGLNATFSGVCRRDS
jgi:hypothetical protein